MCVVCLMGMHAQFVPMSLLSEFHCIKIIQIIQHSTVNRHLSCFQFGVVNKVTTSIFTNIFWWMAPFFILGWHCQIHLLILVVYLYILMNILSTLLYAVYGKGQFVFFPSLLSPISLTSLSALDKSSSVPLHRNCWSAPPLWSRQLLKFCYQVKCFCRFSRRPLLNKGNLPPFTACFTMHVFWKYQLLTQHLLIISYKFSQSHCLDFSS